MRKAKYFLSIKWFICVIALAGMIGFGVFIALKDTTENLEVPKKPEIEMRDDIKVVIDPGHGGLDPGTHDGEGFFEKDVNLDIGLRMRDYLLAQGVPVIMTRETDEDVSDTDGDGRHRRDLERRVEIINQGTLGVSIHANSAKTATERGFIVFYSKGNEEGKALAENTIKALAPIQHPNHDFPVLNGSLYLLRNAKVPIILVEVGFISNPEDRNKLKDPSYLQQIAEALGRAVVGDELQELVIK